MASRALTRPAPLARTTVLSVALALGALAGAAVIAGLLVYRTKDGIELLAVLCFAPIALLRLPLAICVFVVLTFFSHTAALDSGLNKLLLFFGVCWIGLLIGRRGMTREVLSHNRTIVLLVIAFIVWMVLSLAWAPEPSAASRVVKELLYDGLFLVLLVGIFVERRHVRWLAAAFIAGAALTVLWGAARGGLNGSEAGEVIGSEGRFQGGIGDPNYLAAVLVPAIMLAGSLAVRRVASLRILLALTAVVIAVGLAATESRGGLIAAVVCAAVALVVWRGRRVLIGMVIVLAVLTVVAFFVSDPTALHRIQQSNQGNGRLDIWRVAWRIARTHPIVGIGIGQFPVVSPRYVLVPGALNFVEVIIGHSIVVHNMYLQLWVEDGVVGLALFLSVVIASLASCWRAARRFDAQGDTEMSALARAGFLGLIGMLTACFFLSDLDAPQLWVLLSFGPVLAGVAARQQRATLASQSFG